MTRRRAGSRVAATLGVAAAAAVAWGTLIERNLFTVRRHTLPVLPAGAAPIRVLQLSDLHLAPWQRRKTEWVRSLAGLNPDLLVTTGDLMGHTEALPTLRQALAPFAGVPGVFVHGSNDYYGPLLKNPLKYLREPSRKATRAQDIDNAAVTALLRDEIGLADLNNDAAALTIRGTRLELAGLNDPHIGYERPDEMRAALAALRAEGPESDVATPVRIGVVHAPYQAALGALLSEGADLLLAGHTHGGQVQLPGIGALTTNCDLPNDQASGLSVWYDAHRAAFLNVSAGLGTSIYAPVRFACRPEASLIVLEPAAD
ncbi:metallophosphoesterase [Leucobacter sp. M11]|nr:metallophosphoesterase [Leucobacter sp. M11]MEB4614581.1 metallophosphoesterase [Leucobacter sp. M11]